MEHMLREIFEKDGLYLVEIRWDGSVYVATLFIEGNLLLRVAHLSMFDAVSGLHTHVMNS